MKDMRLLKLYNRLLKNDDIDVEEYAKENGVSTRTVKKWKISLYWVTT